ncbi:MAG: hypothetical protein AB8H80_15680, partial [Planctomycetota bacterium]
MATAASAAFASLLFASPASGQCFVASGSSIQSLLIPSSIFFFIDDESRSVQIPLNGFTFPMRGTNWTHFVVTSNGEIFLTDGNGPVGITSVGPGSLSEVRGAPGESPRIIPFGSDLSAGSGPGVWDLLVDDSVANEVKVTWSNVRRFGLTANWCVSATLFASGEVRFDYSDGLSGVPGATQFVAISAGDGVGT